MGDVVGLVEKAAQTIDVEKATKIAEKMKKGVFDLDDMAEQLKQMQRIGGMSGVLGMMPGMGKIRSQIADANLDDGILKRQHAIITSMTPHERRNPKVLDARRKRRIAAGSGTKVEEINRLVKMHRQMADMMKTLGRNKGMLNKLVGGGRGAAPSEAEMAAMQDELSKLDPKALEQLPQELKQCAAQRHAGSRRRHDAEAPRPRRRAPRIGRWPAEIPRLAGKEEVTLINHSMKEVDQCP